MRGKTNTTEGKRRSSFCSRNQQRPPKKHPVRERRGNQRGWKEHQNKEDKKAKTGKALSRCLKRCCFSSSLCLHPPLLLVTTEWNTLPSWVRLPFPLLLHLLLFNLLLSPFVQTGDLKCKRAPWWKSQPSSGQLSTGSLWLDCLCTAVNALGGCWPRWLTVVLGTATHCHVSRWCMRKKKGGEGGPQSTQPRLMMQQRTHLSLKHQQRPLTWKRGLLFDNAIIEQAAAGPRNPGVNEAKGPGCKSLCCYSNCSYFAACWQN